MFDNENVQDGVTLRVYRFDSPMEKGKTVVSFVVRMKGPACEAGNAVIGPVIARRKEKLIADMKEFSEKHKQTLLKKLVAKFKKPTESEKEIARKGSVLQQNISNPLLDFDQLAGEAMLAEIKLQLEEKGLKVQSENRTSNGELDEQVIHFA